MKTSVPKLLLPFLVVAIAVTIAVTMVRSRSELPHRERQAFAPLVEVMTVERGPVTATIHSQGTVRATRAIELVSEVSGKVIAAAPELQEGAQVEAGTTLLRIDPIDYEVAVSDAKAAVASAEFSLAEVTAVLKRAAIDEAEARLQAARDRLRQAEVDLSNTVVKAPFNAIIDSKHVDLGQFVQAGTPVMSLLGTDSVEIRLPVMASDVPYLPPIKPAGDGASAATLIAAFGDVEQRWQARLVRLEDRVDEETRVFYLVAAVASPYDPAQHTHPLPIGLFVEAVIRGRVIENATIVPRSALHGNEQVYVVTDGHLQLRQVDVLRTEGNSVIIGDGLAAGELLVLSRLDLMAEGMAVSVQQG